jgi:hypothetical protein
MNDDYYFDVNFPNAKLRPYDDYKNMSTLNTFCGILNFLYPIRHLNFQKIVEKCL